MSKNRLFKYTANTYVFFFRGTPLLVQIFLIYYGLAQFDIVKDSVLWPYLRQAYWCAIIALSVNTAAYTTEIFRGAIRAVPYGEIEAAMSIGMSRWKRYTRIILPEAIRIGLPAYSNEVILLLKGSALASTVTILDLTGVARAVNSRTFLSYEVFLLAGCFYLAISFIITKFFHRLERRLRHLDA